MGIQSAASISSECASHHRDAQPALLGNSGQATGLGRWLSQDLAIFGESRLLSHCQAVLLSLLCFEYELLNHCFSQVPQVPPDGLNDYFLGLKNTISAEQHQEQKRATLQRAASSTPMTATRTKTSTK